MDGYDAGMEADDEGYRIIPPPTQMENWVPIAADSCDHEEDSDSQMSLAGDDDLQGMDLDGGLVMDGFNPSDWVANWESWFRSGQEFQRKNAISSIDLCSDGL